MVSDLAMRVLREGLDDWVPLAAIVGMARQSGISSDEEVKAATAAVLRELIDNGLASLGQVTSKGFIPSNEPRKTAIERVLSSKGLNTADTWEFNAWLNNTENGDALARQAVEY